ncbi:MAG: hypothetical protein QM749_01650 [Aquabacterium sp.]
MRFSSRFGHRFDIRLEIRKSAISLEALSQIDIFIRLGKPSFRVWHNRLPAPHGIIAGELFLFGQYIPYEFSNWGMATKIKTKLANSAKGNHAHL